MFNTTLAHKMPSFVERKVYTDGLVWKQIHQGFVRLYEWKLTVDTWSHPDVDATLLSYIDVIGDVLFLIGYYLPLYILLRI